MHHSTAILDPRAQIDPAAEVGPYVIVDGPAIIGPGCRLEAHSQIVGDVRIGEGTAVGRGAVIGGLPQDLSFDPATESGVDIGRNNIIREHVTIHRGSKPGARTRLGDGNFVMAGAHFGHDVTAGDKNVFANACLIGGHVHIGSNTFIGGGAVFHQFVRIGDYCVIQGNGGLGMDLPHFCMAQRINRMTGLNVIGLRRAGFSRDDRAAMKEMFDLLFRSGKNLSQAIAAARERTWPDSALRMLDFVAAPSKRGICPIRAAESDEDE